VIDFQSTFRKAGPASQLLSIAEAWTANGGPCLSTPSQELHCRLIVIKQRGSVQILAWLSQKPVTFAIVPGGHIPWFDSMSFFGSSNNESNKEVSEHIYKRRQSVLEFRRNV
jgi:hypothetical protein